MKRTLPWKIFDVLLLAANSYFWYESGDGLNAFIVGLLAASIPYTWFIVPALYAQKVVRQEMIEKLLKQRVQLTSDKVREVLKEHGVIGDVDNTTH